MISLIVDFHGEITSEKMAIGHFFDGQGNFSCWHSHACSNVMMLEF